MHSRCYCRRRAFTPPWPRSVSSPFGIPLQKFGGANPPTKPPSSSSLASVSPTSRILHTVPERERSSEHDTYHPQAEIVLRIPAAHPDCPSASYSLGMSCTRNLSTWNTWV